MPKISKSDFRKILATFLVFFTCGYCVVLTLCDIPKDNVGNANTILGFLLGVALSAIIGVYFGGVEESD